MTLPNQRFTIFQDDDVTPLLGTVSGGVVIVPTASTDPAAARPYMKRILTFSASDVDFVEGRSTIGQLTLQVLDKRTTTDQRYGWFTALLSDGSNNRIVGRRVLIEQQATSGAWYVLMNGVIGDHNLDSSIVTYTLEVRDMRERERNIPLFSTHGTTWSLVPAGLVSDYGAINTSATDVLVPKVKGVKAQYKKDPTQTKAGVAIVVDWNGNNKPDVDQVRDIVYLTTATPYTQAEMAGVVALTTHYYQNVGFRWRPWGSSGAWTTLTKIPYFGDTTFSSWGSALQYGHIPGQNVGQKGIKSDSVCFIVNTIDGLNLPSDNQFVEIQMLYMGALADKYPLFIECSFGQLLKDILNGVYSDGDTLGVDYDSTVIDALVFNTPTARLRVQEPVDDTKTWLEKNWYKPLGYAPTLNTKGQLSPTKYALPNADAVLVQLDDTNVKEAQWMHSYKDVSNKIDFTYVRENAVRDPGEVIGWRIEERKVEFIELHASVGLFGAKPVTYEPVTVRSRTRASVDQSVTDNTLDELGGQLALARWHEIKDRFAYGAQRLTLKAFRSDSSVASVMVGDWVLVGVSYLPDYETGIRGMSRIGQVVKIQDMDPVTRSFEILDGGPFVQPLSVPTIGSVTLTNQRIKVVMSAIPANTESRIDYAIAPTVPATSSGVWTFVGRTSSTGTPIYTPPIPNDSIIWIRARSEGANRRPSAYVVPTSFTVPSKASVRGVMLQVDDSSGPKVIWDTTSGASGLRIYYQTFSDGSTPSAFAAHVDVAISAGSTVIPITLHQFENIICAVEPWTGFTSGAVTGSAGDKVMVRGKRVSSTFIAPAFQEQRTQDSTNAYLTIVGNDPQFRISSVEFRTQVGIASAFSVWNTDSSIPYQADAPLLENDSTIIEYRVNTIGDDGTTSIVGSGQVLYTKGLSGFVECRASYAAATATTITIQADGISPNGGTVQVELVSVAGSAALVSGPAIGVLSATGTQWVFSRGAALGASGQATFRAVQSGLQTDDDEVEIAEQGRDTVPLQIYATVISKTDTTMTVRVTCNDPVSQGGSAYISLAVAETGTGGVSPSGLQSVTNGGHVDYTITRPAFLSGQGRVVWTASATGRVNDTDSQDVPEAQAPGPSLEVKATPSATSTGDYSIVWSSSRGTVTLSIDGGAFSTPSASPITVSRHATLDKTYTFKCVADSQELVDTVVIPSLKSDGLVPDLSVSVGTPTSTTQPYTATFTNPRSGGAAPTCTVTIFGNASMVISGTTYVAADGPQTISSGTVVTANRASSTSTGQSHIVFHASLSGGGSEEISRTIPAQLNVGPNLDVKDTPGATVYTITWTGTGTITYAVDGGSYTTPPASPFTYNRNGSDHSLVFRAVLDGQTITAPIKIPALASNGGGGITSVTLANRYDPCDGGGSWDVLWATAGFPTTGVTFNVLIEVFPDSDPGADDPSYHSQSFVNKTSGDTCGTISLCSTSTGQVTVTAWYGGAIIGFNSTTF